MHVANPGLSHSITGLGVSHERHQVPLEDILGLPVKGTVVLPRLPEVVLLLNHLLHTGAGHWGLGPGGAVHLACHVVINVILLGGVVVHLQCRQPFDALLAQALTQISRCFTIKSDCICPTSAAQPAHADSYAAEAWKTT